MASGFRPFGRSVPTPLADPLADPLTAPLGAGGPRWLRSRHPAVAKAARLTDSVGPGQANRPEDLKTVNRLLTKSANLFDREDGGAGPLLPRRPPVAPPLPPEGQIPDENIDTQTGVFDNRPAVLDFQRRRGLKPDGILHPAGPTVTALAAQAGLIKGALKAKRPKLPGLTGDAVSENARTVAHLKSHGSDGMLPGLLAQAAKGDRKGRSEVADFFAQLRRSDHDRAEQLRDKMGLDGDDDADLFPLEALGVERVLEFETFEDAKRRLAGRPLPLDDDDSDDDDDDGGDDGGDDDGDDGPPPIGDPDDPNEPPEDKPDDPDKPKPPKDPKPDCEDIREALRGAIADLDAVIDEKRAIEQEIFDTERKQAEIERQLREGPAPSPPATPGPERPESGKRPRRPSISQRILDLISGQASSEEMERDLERRERLKRQIDALDAKIQDLNGELEDLANDERNFRESIRELSERLKECESR